MSQFRVVPLGDSAILVVAGEGISNESSKRVYAALDRLEDAFHEVVLSWVPAYATLLGRINPRKHRATQIAKRIESYLNLPANEEKALDEMDGPSAHNHAIVEIPVCYGDEYGPDLDEVATGLSMAPSSVVSLHSGTLYRVAMMGFMPGFAYLTGMPDSIAFPRRSIPRVRVPAGSVGIGGMQTGVYPLTSPGGWQVIGRTPKRLFRPSESDSTVLHTGDYVRFVPISPAEFREQECREEDLGDNHNHGKPIRIQTAGTARTIRIEKPGLFTTIQDLGRGGHEQVGVSKAGAMDFFAASVANLLIGNPANAAVLECTLVGPHLRFHCDAMVAVTGANLLPHVNGRPMPMWQSVRVTKGSELVFAGYHSGVRAYIAIEGGVDVPEVMGSRATDVGAGIGGLLGRILAQGDELALSNSASVAPIRAGRMLHPSLRPTYDKAVTVSFMTSCAPSALPSSLVSSFAKSAHRVLPQSDRKGIRFEGWSLIEGPATDGKSVVSEPVLMGTIQCPEGGSPVVLMADAQTVGGYPTLGTVATVDLPRLAQAAPGSVVHFERTTEEEALSRLLAAYRVLEWLSLANGASGS